MYLYIGEDRLIPVSEMIAVISFKGDREPSKRNKILIKKRMDEEDVIGLTAFSNVKNMVVTKNNLIYISSIAPRPIFKGPKKMNGRKE